MSDDQKTETASANLRAAHAMVVEVGARDSARISKQLEDTIRAAFDPDADLALRLIFQQIDLAIKGLADHATDSEVIRIDQNYNYSHARTEKRLIAEHRSSLTRSNVDSFYDEIIQCRSRCNKLVNPVVEIYNIISASARNRSPVYIPNLDLFYKAKLISKYVETQTDEYLVAKFIATLFPDNLQIKLGPNKDISGETEPLSVSTPPAALWKTDRQPGDNPVAFIKRHYGKWHEGEWQPAGLTRPQLRQSDYALYNALAQHNRRHPEDRLELPNQAEVLDGWVRRVTEGQDAGPTDAKGANRLAWALRRQATKGK